MKLLGGILVALIILIQWPLWLGKGGWLRVWDVDRQLRVQQEKNEQLRQRNNALAADVVDLKQGGDAIEERARYELGMVRPDEVFFQYSNGVQTPESGAPPATGSPAAKDAGEVAGAPVKAGEAAPVPGSVRGGPGTGNPAKPH